MPAFPSLIVADMRSAERLGRDLVCRALRSRGSGAAKQSSSGAKLTLKESKLSPLEESCRQVKTIVVRLKAGVKRETAGEIGPVRRLAAFAHLSALASLRCSHPQAVPAVKRNISGSLRSNTRADNHSLQGRRSLESCPQSKSPTELPRASVCTAYLVDLRICHDCSSQQLHRMAELRELEERLSAEAGTGSILRRKQLFKAAPWVDSPRDRARSVHFGTQLPV